MTDYKWKGPPEEVSAVVYEEDGKTLKEGLHLIGPRVLDGVAYVNIRTENALELSGTLSETGPELSDAVVGVWYDPPTEEQLKAMDVTQKAQAQG